MFLCQETEHYSFIFPFIPCQKCDVKGAALKQAGKKHIVWSQLTKTAEFSEANLLLMVYEEEEEKEFDILWIPK